MYILGIPADQVPMSEKAAQPANADEEEARRVGRFMTDRKLMKQIWTKIWKQIEKMDLKDKDKIQKALEKVSSNIESAHMADTYNI